MNDVIKVYVKLDTNSVITDINSNIFLSDLTNWIEIDEGSGDKYAHAQGNYLEKELMDSNGKYNYKLADGKVVELTDTEKESLFPTPTDTIPTDYDRISALESAISKLMGV
jgi:hypothetical protein